MLTFHERWKAFWGDSTDERNLLFTVKKFHAFSIRKKEVFLATNKQENVCDYSIEGGFSQEDCTIYKGDSSEIIALVLTRSLSLSLSLFLSLKMKELHADEEK